VAIADTDQVEPDTDRERIEPLPCARLHPGWQPGLDYRQAARAERTWEVTAGCPVVARRVEHDPPSLGEPTILPPGSVLGYVGSSFDHGYPPDDFSRHVFQVLGPGPSPRANGSVGLPPRSVPLPGDCCEVETRHGGEDSWLWSSALRAVAR